MYFNCAANVMLKQERHVRHEGLDLFSCKEFISKRWLWCLKVKPFQVSNFRFIAALKLNIVFLADIGTWTSIDSQCKNCAYSFFSCFCFWRVWMAHLTSPNLTWIRRSFAAASITKRFTVKQSDVFPHPPEVSQQCNGTLLQSQAGKTNGQQIQQWVRCITLCTIIYTQTDKHNRAWLSSSAHNHATSQHTTPIQDKHTNTLGQPTSDAQHNFRAPHFFLQR